MNPLLARALKYAATHGTTITETARAMGVHRRILAGLIGVETRAGRPVVWPVGADASTDGEAPLDLVRHVRNGSAFWEERAKPMGDPGRGPSPPTYPTAADSLRCHNTIPGLAWRWALDVAAVEAARVRMGMGVFVTDGEARLLGMVMGACE